jgi:hypothetical protein
MINLENEDFGPNVRAMIKEMQVIMDEHLLDAVVTTKMDLRTMDKTGGRSQECPKDCEGDIYFYSKAKKTLGHVTIIKPPADDGAKSNIQGLNSRYKEPNETISEMLRRFNDPDICAISAIFIHGDMGYVTICELSEDERTT